MSSERYDKKFDESDLSKFSDEKTDDNPTKNITVLIVRISSENTNEKTEKSFSNDILTVLAVGICMFFCSGKSKIRTRKG